MKNSEIPFLWLDVGRSELGPYNFRIPSRLNSNALPIRRFVVSCDQLRLPGESPVKRYWHLCGKNWGFAWQAKACWHKGQRHQFICKHKSLTSSLTHQNLLWRLSNKIMHLVAGCVMQGSMVFFQKNILEHSMSFHGDYKKRFLITHRVSRML